MIYIRKDLYNSLSDKLKNEINKCIKDAQHNYDMHLPSLYYMTNPPKRFRPSLNLINNDDIEIIEDALQKAKDKAELIELRKLKNNISAIKEQLK